MNSDMAEPDISRRLRDVISIVNGHRRDCVAELLVVTDLLCHEAYPELVADMGWALRNMRFWPDQPGRDRIDFLREDHQIAFSVAEYLAGQRFPDELFLNSARKGVTHQAQAETRIRRWLNRRFRDGFALWLSPAPFALMIPALIALVEHADDDSIRTRAAMIADLAFADLAMHQFEGVFAPSAAIGSPDSGAGQQAISDILMWAFEGLRVVVAIENPVGILLRSTRYRVPVAIRSIAYDDRPAAIYASTGRNLDEVAKAVESGVDPDALATWGELNANRTTQALGTTQGSPSRRRRAVRRGVSGAVHRAGAAAREALLNPVSQGEVITRANVQTFRTGHYLFSSVQHYRVGEFGHEERLWQAVLPGDATVYANHPRSDPGISPWLGNGVMPDVAQQEHVLLACYDTNSRAGLGEGRRVRFSHVHFPFMRFDETRLGSRWVVGRSRGTFIAVVAARQLEMVSNSELVQHGDVTAYAVYLADRSQYFSLTEFANWVKGCPLHINGSNVVWWTPQKRYELSYQNQFTVDGRPVGSNYPRVESPWVNALRNPMDLEFSAQSNQLSLDWARGRREASPG